MILGCLGGNLAPSSGTQPASQVFMSTEKQIHPPCAIALQADHARLAGDLARALEVEAFGEFPDEVIQATAQHDFGWTASDMAQLERLGEADPLPFPSLTWKQTQTSWDACIEHGRSLSPLSDVLISRHFTALAGSDPERAEFVRRETARRQMVERLLPYTSANLDGWTAVLGFCDLLSLYLCCGATQTVEFPLAHPASVASRQARKVTLSWERGQPRFSAGVLKGGTQVGLDAKGYSGHGRDTQPLYLSWRFE